jgi:hypothetical protein
MKSDLPLIGSMFLLVILVLLGMVSFGVLALTSSAADLRYAESAASWTVSYYLLEAEANKRLMRADGILRGIYGEDAARALSLLEDEGWVIVGDTASSSISLDNGTGQNLNVEFVISYPGVRKNYEIISWRLWQDKFEYDTGGLLIWPGE